MGIFSSLRVLPVIVVVLFPAIEAIAQPIDPIRALHDYWTVVASLPPSERRNVVYHDFKQGYIVSREGIRLLSPADVLEHPASREAGFVGTDGGGIAPYRRVKSIPGYSIVEGFLNLPATLTGVNQAGEAAYNYFGVQRSGDDVEAGVVSSTVTTLGRWFAFYHLGTLWGPPSPGWPPGGMAPGGTVFMRLSVIPPRIVSFYISYTDPEPNLLPQEATFTFNSEELDPYGLEQRVRRITSLLLNTASGSSKTNAWSGVKIGTYLNNPYLWLPKYTDEAITSPTQYVTVFEHAPYYVESIDIEAP